MKARRVESGTIQASLYPVPYRSGDAWIPTEEQEEALFELRSDAEPDQFKAWAEWQVLEVGSCGAQSYHVIVEFEDIETLRRCYDEAVRQVAEVINGSSARAAA